MGESGDPVGGDEWLGVESACKSERISDHLALNLARALSGPLGLGDGVTAVLTLLDQGRSSTARGHRTAAAMAFGRAAALARKTATTEQSRLPELQRLLPLSRMVEALREAGLEEVALEVEVLAGMKEDRSTSVTVSNRADNVHAHTVVQVGVVHGSIHIAGGPGGRDGNSLNVSVVTSQDETTIYEFEGVRVHPDKEVGIFVEAFTAQAVLLHRLRPVFVREVAMPWTPPDTAQATPREFELDFPVPAPPGPAHKYDADVPGQALRLNGASAEGGTGFPFFVTASDPEYFVIRPKRRGGVRRAVEWRLELDWSCLGQHGTVTIGHSYRPFLSNG